MFQYPDEIRKAKDAVAIALEIVGLPNEWPSMYRKGCEFPLKSAARNKLTAFFYVNGVDPETIKTMVGFISQDNRPMLRDLSAMKNWICNVERLHTDDAYRARVYAWDICLRRDVFANGRLKSTASPWASLGENDRKLYEFYQHNFKVTAVFSELN